jgi:FkbM family methyltransferase
MLKIWPHATIHSFEPVPKIYKKLLDNTKGRKNIFTYPYALGSESGVSDIFISSGGSDASSSLLQPKEHKIDYPDVHFLESNQIKIITLDQWASDNQIPRVDFAWLDMQGYELSALKSGQTVLKKMQAVYTEVFLKELYKDAPLYAEIKLWFESQGFKVEIEEMASDSVGNVLFIRK